jgi:hypothetical protein
LQQLGDQCGGEGNDPQKTEDGKRWGVRVASASAVSHPLPLSTSRRPERLDSGGLTFTKIVCPPPPSTSRGKHEQRGVPTQANHPAVVYSSTCPTHQDSPLLPTRPRLSTDVVTFPTSRRMATTRKMPRPEERVQESAGATSRTVRLQVMPRRDMQTLVAPRTLIPRPCSVRLLHTFPLWGSTFVLGNRRW